MITPTSPHLPTATNEGRACRPDRPDGEILGLFPMIGWFQGGVGPARPGWVLASGPTATTAVCRVNGNFPHPSKDKCQKDEGNRR